MSQLRSIFLFHIFLVLTECLLNPASSTNSHTEQIIEELQRNMTKLFSKNSHSERTIAELQQNMTKYQGQMEAMILDRNRTMSDLNRTMTDLNRTKSDLNRTKFDLDQKQIVIQEQDRKISDLEQKQKVTLVIVGKQQRTVSEMNQTIRDQQRKINDQERKITGMNQTIIDQQGKIDSQQRTIKEMNHTKGDQQQKIDILRNENIDQNATILGLESLVLEQNRTLRNQQRINTEINRTMAVQQRNIDTLENQNTEHNATILKLESLVFEMNKSIGNEQQKAEAQYNQHYREIYGHMNATFSAYQLILRDVVDKHNQYVTHSDNQTRVLDQRVADLGRQFRYLSLSVGDARKEASVLNTSLHESQKNVAFTVSLSVSGANQNMKIVYDKILINIGNGYSSTTGVFTCPSDGEYVFTWSTMNYGATCFAYIYRNGVQYLKSASQERDGSLYESASNTEVFHLNKGDTVWIQTTICDTFFGYPHTAFSGWKL